MAIPEIGFFYNLPRSREFPGVRKYLNYSSNIINISNTTSYTILNQDSSFSYEYIKRIPLKFRFDAHARVEFPVPVQNETSTIFCTGIIRKSITFSTFINITSSNLNLKIRQFSGNDFKSQDLNCL